MLPSSRDLFDSDHRVYVCTFHPTKTSSQRNVPYKDLVLAHADLGTSSGTGSEASVEDNKLVRVRVADTEGEEYPGGDDDDNDAFPKKNPRCRACSAVAATAAPVVPP